MLAGDVSRADNPGPDYSTQTRTRILDPRSLLIVRLGWGGLLALCLVLVIVGVPAEFNNLHRVCSDETGLTCVDATLTPTQMDMLRDQGISLDFYAGWLVTTDIVILVVSYLAALMIFWKRPDDWVALLVSVMLVAGGISFTLIGDALQQAQAAWHVLASAVGYLGYLTFYLLLFVFPDGRFVPRRMWPVAVLGALWALTWSFRILLPLYTQSQLMPLSILLTVATLGSGMGAQIYRYCYASSPSQRQQTKWVLIGLAGITLAFLIYLFSLVAFWLRPALVSRLCLNLVGITLLPLVLTFLVVSFPVATALAVVRYHLWDIDLFINRTLVYGTLTVVQVAVFGAALFIINQLVGTLGGEQSSVIVVAVSAAISGALFQPTRRAVQRFVDRWFFHIGIAYGRAAQPPPQPTPTLQDISAFQEHMAEYPGLELIGRGGMAEVYRARHPKLNRDVAIKILFPNIARNPSSRRRFEREAQAIAALKHPNIVHLYDFGEIGNTLYIVMEYIDGDSLTAHMRRVGPMPLEQARPLVADIADALDCAHQQGVVHRDIKPSNIMLAPGSGKRAYRAVLTDFGIAKMLDQGATHLTSAGILGTFEYIAPEQIQASPDVGGKADVYALGIVTYQMLTNRLPFERNHPAAVLIAHLKQPPPDPRVFVPDLPDEAASAILRALAKSPEQRFDTAGEFAAALGWP